MTALLCTVLLSSPALFPQKLPPAPEAVPPAHPAETGLQRAAEGALAGREGAVIVMDPQTGQWRALVNQRAAFASAYPPGSTIKVFTALAALRDRVIDEGSPLRCRGRYRRDDYAITCAHPASGEPFGPAAALAHSCNYYFAKIGERLTAETFDATLEAFGLRGPRENLRGGELRPPDVLGEGQRTLVTPARLLAAYAALANGGKLLTPSSAQTSIIISPAERALLIDGMRGAVEYGTASRAGLRELPLYIFGKTGTATEANHFRSHGWFVGFAAGAGSAIPSPENVKLGVLVFLRRGHGSEAAAVARHVFAEYAKEAPRTETGGERLGGETSPPRAHVRIHLTGADVVKTIPLEEYVTGVVAAEGAIEDEGEALRALAVLARTYAVNNPGRHARQGFDFCDLTHCQRYRPALRRDERERIREAVRRAVRTTAGETLRDGAGRPAEAYFSASCGGITANAATLWGEGHEGDAPPHLRGRRDDYCASSPRRAWTDIIPARQLARALQSDARTQVGARLDRVEVRQYDATGRAQLISLEGERRVTVRGWDFKIIVGRALGWHRLKSSRFRVERAGEAFIFRGSGFGHGLGLCQEGAHVMARRGYDYRQILDFYFPGTQPAKH